MIDTFGRSITYLRVSVTELCNLRCRYCMPEDGVCKKEHADMLTEDEFIQAVEAAAALGITKLRITGGEPLVKKNIVSICRRASRVPGIREVCLTTNGILLPELARPLKEAGVSRLNLSLDTLDPQKYAHITRSGSLDDFWKGFHAALDADFQKIKLNAVLIGGFNDDEILPLAELTRKYPVDVRFIEMMPMCDSSGFGPEAYIPFTRVLEALPEAVPAAKDGGVAKLFHLPGALGNIGLISPGERPFLRRVQPHPTDCRRKSEALSAFQCGVSPERAGFRWHESTAGSSDFGKTPMAWGSGCCAQIGRRSEYESNRRLSMADFTHFNDQGRAKMVDVGEKPISQRVAVAAGRALVHEPTFALIQSGGMKKGDVLTVAQIAGVMGAKRTPDIIPMCHPILMDGINLELSLDEHRSSVEIKATVSCDGRTGVEMEALTAVSTAALTVYDMCKAVQKDMTITDIRLLSKTGGIHGDYKREDESWRIQQR